MDLKDLLCFQAVAHTLNLSRAAHEARVAQPALSRRMSALERELGVTLLTRHPKGVTLTPAGASFAQGSRQLLDELGAALDRAEATAAGRRGQVVFAAVRAAIARGFPTTVQDSLHAEYPEITVEIEDIEPPDIWEAVADGRADVGVCIGHPPLSGLLAEPLWVEYMDRAIVPRDHPLAARGTVSLPEFGPLPFVVSRSTLAPEPGGRVEMALRAAGLRSPSLELDGDLRATHLAVAAGRGWTLMTRSRALAPPEGTVVLAVTGITITLPVMAVWRKGDRRPVVQTALRRMRDVARSYPESQVRAVATPSAPSSRARRPHGTVPPGLELKHLRALLTVATALTIGRAAARLGITQPALSRQLRDLENAVGVALLERSARGVALTPAGVSLAGDSPALLAGAERLLGEATRYRRGVEGRCVIGAVATGVSIELLARVTERCAARHPDVQIVVQEMPTPEQAPALGRADIDLGIAHAFPSRERARSNAIVITHLQKDRLATALLAREHPLASRRSIEARELADIPFLFMERAFHPGFYDRLYAELKKLGLRPRVEATYDGLQTVWALAAQGKGWAMGFQSQLDRPPAGTTAVAIRGLKLPFGLDLLSRRGESSPAVRAVAALFKEAARTARPRAR
ncbi:MAG TPA: LysR substrate-binding domain-containing protein [Gemmatimonadales bacterium]|nr:LysR substrate-binding domain-containing protein [Gemmatimonadales bacterium]